MRKKSVRKHEPGTIFVEKWGLGVVVGCEKKPVLSGSPAWKPEFLYDITLRRMSEEDEAVLLVMAE